MTIRGYKQNIVFNGRVYLHILISDHYGDRHSDISDDLILQLCSKIDGLRAEPDTVDCKGFAYYKVEPVFIDSFPYRLILTIDLQNHDYIGVVNAFRVKRKR